MGRSPAHYVEQYLNGSSETSPAMLLGSAIHLATLENSQGLVKWDGARRAGKEWEKFVESAPQGSTILTADEWAKVHAIAASVHAHPRAAELLDGAREQVFDWTMDGRACRGTADVVAKGGRIVDLKSTTDASPSKFPHTAEKLGYHAQLPWYMNGARLAGLGEFTEAYIVAVETKPPYVVQTFQLGPFALDIGARTWRAWWERYLVCDDANDWPGYSQTDAILEVTTDLDLIMGGESITVE
jgi:exodeoxyribonuclease VIII